MKTAITILFITKFALALILAISLGACGNLRPREYDWTNERNICTAINNAGGTC